VLIVEDDPSMRELLRATLEVNGFEVAGEAADGADGVRRFDELDPPPAAVVLDERMPRMTGVETAEQILARRPNQVVVLFSAALDADVVGRALNVGILQCVDKLEVGRLPAVLRVLLGE
jgi:two-component system chemotaxis response regulator CheY